MPELAEVEWYRKRWDPGLDEAVVDLALHARKRIFRGTDTSALRARLLDQKLLSSTTRGKRMLFQVSGESWLGIRLGMTGSAARRTTDYPRKSMIISCLYQAKRALVFRDSRQFGRVRFHHGRENPIGGGVMFLKSFRTSSIRNSSINFSSTSPHTIKAVLLLQNGFCGIGDWMADEIFWRAKILLVVSRRKTQTPRNALRFCARPIRRPRNRSKLSGACITPIRQDWLIHQNGN